MKKVLVMLLAVLGMSISLMADTTSSQSVGNNKNYTMQTYLIKEWLTSEGYPYDEDKKNGIISFKCQGKRMCFIIDEKDPLFFRIIMPGIYKIENNRGKVLEICNEIVSETKVVKAFVVDDDVWLSIEMFIDSNPDIGDFLERCCDILISAYHIFANKIID